MAKKAKREYQLERIVKGFANHRRIQILELLQLQPEMSVNEIAQDLDINFKTIASHIQKLASAGLIMKRSDGYNVRHKLTDKGKTVLRFLKALE